MKDEQFLTELRKTNGERAEAWAEGRPSDPLFWAIELGGEVGEILNVVKKLRREEIGWRGSRATLDDLSDEIADGLICLDSLARHYGIDLAEATVRKFNKTSEKVGLPHRIEASRPAPSEVSGDVVEVVAEALQASAAGLDHNPIQRTWGECSDSTKDNFRRHARNALAALTPAPQADTLRELLIEARDALETFGKQETLEQLYEDDDEWAKFRFLVKDYKRAGQALSRIDAHLTESQTDAD